MLNLIFLVGIPGSGKSTLANDLAKDINAVVIETSEIVKKILKKTDRYDLQTKSSHLDLDIVNEIIKFCERHKKKHVIVAGTRQLQIVLGLKKFIKNRCLIQINLDCDIKTAWKRIKDNVSYEEYLDILERDYALGLKLLLTTQPILYTTTLYETHLSSINDKINAVRAFLTFVSKNNGE